MKLLCFSLALLAFAFSGAAFAKQFRNSYVSFEVPETWNCKLENTEWVCRAEVGKEAKEAIIIVTAKERGPSDTPAAYMTHLATPQPTTYKGALASVSKVTYPPKTSRINDQDWIDGLHQSSEVPNYFTRYLATIKDNIAVLFTCSVHKDFYTKYSNDFLKAVQSLRVIATKDLSMNPTGVRGSNETLGAAVGPALRNTVESGEAEDLAPQANSGSGSATKNLMFGLAAIVGAIGVYLFLKSRKNS
jgi:hypothetical protein